MKKMMLMTAVIALVAIAGYSEDDKDAKEPAELTAAKKDYAEQIEKVTAPVKTKQISRLEKLKKQLTTKGDLQGALAVQAEIDSMSGVASKAVGKWKWPGGETIELCDDGTTVPFPGTGWTGTWKTSGKKTEISWSNNSIDTLIIIAADGNKATLTNNKGGGPYTITRVK